MLPAVCSRSWRARGLRPGARRAVGALAGCFPLHAGRRRRRDPAGGGRGAPLPDGCLAEGVLLEGAAASPYLLPRPAPRPSLRYLELLVTDRCNLRCRHCYLGDAPGRDLPLPVLERVAREFEGMQGLRLLISGGEPLLHPDFWAFNALLPGLGPAPGAPLQRPAHHPRGHPDLTAREVQLASTAWRRGTSCCAEKAPSTGSWPPSGTCGRRGRRCRWPPWCTAAISGSWRASPGCWRGWGSKSGMWMPCARGAAPGGPGADGDGGAGGPGAGTPSAGAGAGTAPGRARYAARTCAPCCPTGRWPSARCTPGRRWGCRGGAGRLLEPRTPSSSCPNLPAGAMLSTSVAGGAATGPPWPAGPSIPTSCSATRGEF